MSLLFAPTYPERVAALVLWGGMARMLWAPDYPWGPTEEVYASWRSGGIGSSGPGARPSVC